MKKLTMFVLTSLGPLAWADGLCDRLLADRLIRLPTSAVPFDASHAARAALTTADEREATVARLTDAARALDRVEPKFTADLLRGGDDLAADALRIIDAKSFTIHGRKEISGFLDEIARPNERSAWYRNAWVTPGARALRWAGTTAALALAGFVWMPHTGMEQDFLWAGTGLASIAFGVYEVVDHARGAGEQNAIARVRKMLAAPDEDHAPIFIGRGFGGSSVHLLYTPSAATLDVVWTHFEVDGAP